MAIGSTGAISFAGTIGVELGRSATATISMSESAVYTLAGVGAGVAISFSTFYGKSNSLTYNLTIAANTADYNVKTAAVAAGWNGTSAATINVTINSAVYVYSTSTGSYAFDTGTSYPTGCTLTLTNNGTILGMGGAGGNGYAVPGVVDMKNPGFAGGPALYAQRAINITNNGIISGGGGGGGAGNVGTW
jgi:hypothetical protein